MDSKRFDNLARSFAETTDRRAALRFILGAVAAWLGMLAGRFSARAATPAMTLSPTSGKIKTAVTATITGFRASETITLLWFDGSTSKSIAAGLTNSNGAATISFTTPYAFRGYHVVRAKGNKGSVADSRFAIVPSFTLKPKKGPAGTATKASLSGFAKGVTIDVYFYSTADRSGTATKLTSTVVSGTGTGAAYFNVPSGATLGIHRIEGRERVSGRLASAKFVVACTSASQCPGVDSECAHRTCINGYCGMAKEPAGTPIANQTAGDCQTDVCDGNGGVTSQPDNSDVPDDGNECTVGICVEGIPGSSPSTAGTPCSTGECDGFGTCVPPAEGACAPGAPTFSEPCYEGPPGTAGMGICQAGMRTCQDGVWGACVGQVLPSPEICNGLDDDCDGVVDDGFPVGEPCDNGHLGICHQTGTYVCSPDGSQVICDAPVVSPQPETCNGLDDDCDGLVDEGAICPDVANGTSACVQAVCMTVACNSGFANCNGNQADGCETNLMTNPLHCGGCGQVCSGSCVNGVCCQTQAQACAGKNCGIVTNNCGQQFSCGICSAPSTCGGGGTANLCGCTPATCDQLGKSCGSFSDGCGGSVDCGSCDTGEICNPNGFCQPL